jgi:hypothetical protein
MRKITTLSTMLVVLAMAACASDQAPVQQPDTAKAPTMVVEEFEVETEADVYIDPVANIYGDAPFVEDTVLVQMGSDADGNDMTRLVSTADGGLPPLTIEQDEIGGVMLKSGKHLTGKVVSDDGNRVQLEVRTKSGATATTGVSYSQLHPRSVCELSVARTEENDMAGHQAIAEYAEAHGLLMIARVHYSHVAENDPALADAAKASIARLAERASTSELARGRKALAKGTGKTGERILLRLQREFPGTPAANDAARLLSDFQETKQSERMAAKRDKKLDPILSLYHLSQTETRSGVAQSASDTRALKDLRQARKHALSAESKLASAMRFADGDPALQQALASLKDQINEQFIDNQLHIAGISLAKGDLKGANQAVGEALERDPDNREGIALRTRIDVEEHSDDDDWVWRRRRGDYPFGYRRYGSRGWDGTRADGASRGGAGTGTGGGRR